MERHTSGLPVPLSVALHLDSRRELTHLFAPLLTFSLAHSLPLPLLTHAAPLRPNLARTKPEMCPLAEHILQKCRWDRSESNERKQVRDRARTTERRHPCRLVDIPIYCLSVCHTCLAHLSLFVVLSVFHSFVIFFSLFEHICAPFLAAFFFTLHPSPLSSLSLSLTLV